MTHSFSRRLALAALVLLLPSAAWAQKEPGHTKETKNAEKFIGLAMTRQDAEVKRQFLEQALPPLREAMQKNPENGRVWLMAGNVFAGLGQYQAADSAFKRALELYPGYAEQIDNERHLAWESAFNTAIGLINQQKLEEGIVALETAEQLYAHRPEAKFYLGLLYSQKNDPDKAEKAFNGTIEAVNGPVRARLQPEAQADWDRLAHHAKIRLSNVTAMRAADLYDAGKYEEAAAKFVEARNGNPHSRDHLFNQLQSVYARALDLDKQREGTKSSTLNEQAQTIYTKVIELTDSLRTVDPRNEDIFFFSSRAHKVLSEVAADAAGKKSHMDALLKVNTEYESLTFLVGDIQISEGETEATVTGNVIRKKLAVGGTATFDFEVVGFDGQALGTAPVSVTVPAGTAADAKIPFTVTVPTNAPVAGWRYTLK